MHQAFIRQHHYHKMRPIVTILMWLCLPRVCWSRAWAVQKRLNRLKRCSGVDSQKPKKRVSKQTHRQGQRDTLFPYCSWRNKQNYASVCCWLGGRKGIQPVKKLSGGVLTWLSVCSEVQTCIRPSCCHCHSLSLASVKSRLVLPFWYRPTWVLPDTHTHPFNGHFFGNTGWAGIRKVKPIRILLKQETVSGSGISWAICKSAPSSI